MKLFSTQSLIFQYAVIISGILISKCNGQNILNSLRSLPIFSNQVEGSQRRNISLPKKLTTISLIERNNYPYEIHSVTTEDGYILELHRIPFGLESPEGPGKIPVIIQHGNFQSSADFMLNRPPNNLPLLLADNGYDVWLGNQRGNTYSNKHVKYAFRSPKFWNYSYHEAALYDVKAMIDYVLEQTNSKKVHYVSHSVGSKNFLAGLTLRPEYNEKIGIGVLMGPAGYMGHMFNGYARLISPLLRIGQLAFNIYGPRPSTPHFITNIEKFMRPFMCQSNIDRIGVCSAFFYSAFGLDREQITEEKLEEIHEIFPSTSSFKLFIHLVQEIQSGHYRQFDYGFNQNIIIYGQPNPPDYNLSLVTAPIAILHGDHDHIARFTQVRCATDPHIKFLPCMHRIEDTEALAKQLPNLVDFYTIPWKNWTHMDFDYAKDAGKLCYSHILELLEKYRF